MKEKIEIEFATENIDEVLSMERDFVVPFAMTLEKNNLYVEIYSDALEKGKAFKDERSCAI